MTLRFSSTCPDRIHGACLAILLFMNGLGAAPAVSRAPAGFDNYGLSVGLYSTDSFGASPFAALSYDFSLESSRFFFQILGGVSSVQSSFDREIFEAQPYENNLLLTLEGLLGYPLKGFQRESGPHSPFLLMGITALYQGGVPNVGLVGGFGQKLPVPFMKTSSRFALQYSLRDEIYSQKYSTADPVITHNLAVTVGLQYYR